MKRALHQPWPPLIKSGQVPWIIRVRDYLFTVLAWLALGFSLRLGLLLLWDYFSHPIFELTRMKAPDWGLIWASLSAFAFLILGAAIWITAWGIGRRPQLRQVFDARVTPSLSLEEHAASLGLDPREVEQWRQWPIVTVHFTGDRIAEAQQGGREDTNVIKDALPDRATSATDLT
jgi:hypothetical protein